MTRTERAYLAGIIDGEGTITLTRKHRNNMPSPQLSVSNNNLQLLEYIREITNCGYIRAKRIMKPTHNQSWHWQTHSVRDILRVLDEIHIFLRVKKLQADLILKHYRKLTPRNGRYSPEILEKKMWLVKIVQNLNRNKSESPIIR